MTTIWPRVSTIGLIIVKRCFVKWRKTISWNSKINTRVRRKSLVQDLPILLFIEGSEEEKTDLKRIYLETGGDMDQIFERHLLTCLEDEGRLRSMIDQMIEHKDVPPFDAYTNETKAKRNKRHKKVIKSSFGTGWTSFSVVNQRGCRSGEINERAEHR